MEFYFDIDFEESEDANDENPKIKDENSDENISIKKKINNDESLLIFEEFFPIQKVKREKKQKTTYIENFGEENELKTFLYNLKLIDQRDLKIIN